MEVPQDVYNWLRATELFKVSKMKEPFILSDEVTEMLESGLGFVKVIKRMNQLKVTVIKNKLDRLSTPFPKLNTLKQATGPAVKLFNWKIIFEALESFGLSVDADMKSLIIAGDPDMIIDIIRQIIQAESKGFPNSYNSEKKKENGVDIEEINQNKSLDEAESCVEFLILSLSNSLEIKPKQATGLLAQGCRPLALLMTKGLKGNFSSLSLWLQEIYASNEKLCELILAESEEGSTNFVLSALKNGIVSKNDDVVQWTLRVLSRLILDLSEKELMSEVWKWMTEESVIEMFMIGLKTSTEDINNSFIDLLLQISQYSYLEFFSVYLRNCIDDDNEYVLMVNTFLDRIVQSETIFEQISISSVVSHWVDLGIKLAEDRNSSNRTSALVHLVKVVTLFIAGLEEYETDMNTVLSLLNRMCREDNKTMRFLVLGMMFYLLEFFVEAKSSFAPILYRTLTFILVETYSVNDSREFMQRNFLIVFKNCDSMPIAILIEPYIKRLQVSDVTLDIFDYEFLSELSQYPQLSLRNAIQLIDIIGKYYLTDISFSKICGVPFTQLASKFIQERPMQDYLNLFVEYSLNVVITTEKLKLQPKAPADIDEKLQQRNRILDIICWIIQQWQDNLNIKIKDQLLTTNSTYMKAANSDCKGIIVALDLIGDSAMILKDFREQNPMILPLEPQVSIENYQLALVSEVVRNPQKGAFPWERVNGGIEKAKKRKLEKDNKAREEELRLKKALDFKKKKIKQQLDIRKLEHNAGHEQVEVVYKEGVVQRHVAKDEITLKLFTEAESDLEESVRLVISKYSRVFKMLFSKYSGTGFEKKNYVKSDFEKHAERKWKLNDAEYIKIMKDFSVIPKLMTKEELRGIMRTYNHTIAKQAEQSYVDYKGFKGVFCQIAYFVYSRRSFDYSHLPPMVSVKLLIDFMRDSLRNKDASTEIFDEPDPGTGDKQVVINLTRELALNPMCALPEGYEKITDREVSIYFSVPSQLIVPQAFRYSIEILDSILAKAVGVRFLEAQVKYSESYRAKGTAPKKVEIKLDKPVYERLFEKKKRISNGSESVEKTEKVTAAPLKSLKPPRAENEGAVKVKDNRKKSIEKSERSLGTPDDLKKLDDDRKRKARQEKLLEEISKAKEARMNMLKEEEEKRKNQAYIDEINKKKADERLRREVEEKKRKLLEWSRKKSLEEEKVMQSELKAKEESENNNMSIIKKKNNDKLKEFLREKEKQNKIQKREAAMKLQKEIEEKREKKERGIKYLLENKAKELEKPKDSKKEIILLLANKEVQSFINKYLDPLADIFTIYLNEMSGDISSNGSIDKRLFTNLCEDFSITSFISSDQCSSAFNFLTHKKNIPVINLEEFQKSLIIIANQGKEGLEIEESGVKPLEKLFELCGFTMNPKLFKQRLSKIKGKYQKIKPKKAKRLINAVKFVNRSHALGRYTEREESRKSRRSMNRSVDEDLDELHFDQSIEGGLEKKYLNKSIEENLEEKYLKQSYEGGLEKKHLTQSSKGGPEKKNLNQSIEEDMKEGYFNQRIEKPPEKNKSLELDPEKYNLRPGNQSFERPLEQKKSIDLDYEKNKLKPTNQSFERPSEKKKSTGLDAEKYNLRPENQSVERPFKKNKSKDLDAEKYYLKPGNPKSFEIPNSNMSSGKSLSKPSPRITPKKLSNHLNFKQSLDDYENDFGEF